MRLKIVGCHPNSHGSECVIFGCVTVGGHSFTPVGAETRELRAFGRWDARPMRPGLGPETAPALVGTDVGGDYCRTSGRLVVLSHSWSGRLQVNNIDRKYTVDLYSQQTRLILLDLIAEIAVDVSALACLENDAIRLPSLTREAIVQVIAERRAWFRFLEPDPEFQPGLLRRALGRRRRRTEGFKLTVVSRLLPELASRPAPPPSSAPSADPGLRDEIRLLAAAVEGLALRAPAEA